MGVLPKKDRKIDIQRKIIVMAEAVEAVANFKDSDFELLVNDEELFNSNSIREIRYSEAFLRGVLQKIEKKLVERDEKKED